MQAQAELEVRPQAQVARLQQVHRPQVRVVSLQLVAAESLQLVAAAKVVGPVVVGALVAAAAAAKVVAESPVAVAAAQLVAASPVAVVKAGRRARASPTWIAPQRSLQKARRAKAFKARCARTTWCSAAAGTRSRSGRAPILRLQVAVAPVRRAQAGAALVEALLRAAAATRNA